MSKNGQMQVKNGNNGYIKEIPMLSHWRYSVGVAVCSRNTRIYFSTDGDMTDDKQSQSTGGSVAYRGQSTWKLREWQLTKLRISRPEGHVLSVGT